MRPSKSNVDAPPANQPRVACMRKIIHIICFLGMLLVCYSLFIGVSWEKMRYETEVLAYAAKKVTTIVSGCDVSVVDGVNRQFEVRGLAGYAFLDASTVKQDTYDVIKVSNPHDCDEDPFFHCRVFCEVIITVPKSAAPEVMHIYQEASDDTNHVTVRIQGVVLKNLIIRGQSANHWDRAGRSLQVAVTNTIVTGDVKISLNDGVVEISRSTFHGPVDIRSRNSVSLLDMPGSERFALNWRQPNNKVCMRGSAGQLILPDPLGPFGQCESTFLKSAFKDFYDTTGDSFLDFNEVRDRLSDVPVCCGGKCPHASWCDGLLYKVFPFGNSSDASLAGRDRILSIAGTWNNLKTQGLAGLVPYCFQQTQLTSPVLQERILQGWPQNAHTPRSPRKAQQMVAYSCLRHSDCFTGYCSKVGTCAANPKVLYTFVHSWSSCDQPCGGGQQVREMKCIGSDGHQYPDVLCGNTSSVRLVQSCNTQACVLPKDAPLLEIGHDKDLRSDWVEYTMSLQPPADAHGVRVHLGTKNAVLGIVAEQKLTDCTGTPVQCDLHFNVQLPSYVDRLYAFGFNADGSGPNASAIIIDRAAKPFDQKWTIESAAGVVRVHFQREGQWGKEEGASMIPDSGVVSWHPPGKKPTTGLRIYYDDAHTMMKGMGKLLGDPEAEEHGMVVIDVVGAPGVPESRWLYATRPVYLAISPAHLHFFSVGLLTPKLYRFRVRFEDLSCGPLPPGEDLQNYQNAGTQERLSSIYLQLLKSLRSDGWATDSRVRGSLILLAPEHKIAPEAQSRWYFEEDTTSDGDIRARMKKFSQGKNGALMDSAIMVSMTVGILFSILMMRSIFFITNQALFEYEKEMWVKSRMLNSKLGEKHEEQKPKKTRRNPFEQPSKLIHILVFVPIRRRYVNSLKCFTDAMCEVEPEVEPLPNAETGPLTVKVDVSKLAGHAEPPMVQPPMENQEPRPPQTEPVLMADGKPAEVPSARQAEAIQLISGLPDETRKGRVNAVTAREAREIIRGMNSTTMLRQTLSRVHAEINRGRQASAPGDYLQMTELELGAEQLQELVDEIEARLAEKLPNHVPGKEPEPPVNPPPLPSKDGIIDRRQYSKRTMISCQHAFKSFCYMRDFRHNYEEFCIREGLDSISNEKHIVQMLAKWYGVRVLRGTAWRMRGVQWREVPVSRPKPAKSSFETFASEWMEVTLNKRHDWVDVKTRKVPSGETVEGMASRFNEYANQKGDLKPKPLKFFDPCNDQSPVVAFARKHAVSFSQVSNLMIPRITLLSKSVHKSTSHELVQGLAQVLINLSLLLSPPAIIIVHSLFAQKVYAETEATQDPLTWIDIVGTWSPFCDYIPSEKQMMFLLRIAIPAAITYMAIAIAHVFFYYLDVEWCGKKMIDRVFGVVLPVMMFCILTVCGTLLAWAVLAAVLDPHHMLQYGTAVAVLGFVCATTRNELVAMVVAVEKQVSDKVDATLNRVLHEMREVTDIYEEAEAEEILQLHERQHEKMGAQEAEQSQADLTQRKGLENASSFDEYHAWITSVHNKKNRKPMTPSDIFDFLDEDGDGLLDRSQFQKLFTAADAVVNDSQVEQFFAYCDTDGNGAITAAELEDGWDYLRTIIVQQYMSNLGVSKGEIYVILFLTMATICCLFAFIFLALPGWFSAQAFDTVIQSFLLAASGKLATKFRKKAEFEKLTSREVEAEGDGEGDGGGDGGGG